MKIMHNFSTVEIWHDFFRHTLISNVATVPVLANKRIFEIA